jgi:polysaccharide export outer membrane protein
VQPGAQPFSNAALTLGEAIARSGGPRRGEAQMQQVRVIRANSPVSGELFVVDFTRVLNGEAMDMPLQPGDIVYMPVNGMGGWNDIIKAISPTIVTLGRALDPFVLAKALENN